MHAQTHLSNIVIALDQLLVLSAVVAEAVDYDWPVDARVGDVEL